MNFEIQYNNNVNDSIGENNEKNTMNISSNNNS